MKDKIFEILEKKKAFDHAIALLHWDLETEAPKMALEKIAATMGFLSAESYSLIINDDFKNMLYNIETESLSDLDKKVIETLRKDFEKLEKIPKEEYVEYSQLTVEATSKWEEAKNADDFEIFKPYLEKIINFNKRFIKYRGYKDHPYNTLLDDYEEGMTVEKTDEFFKKIKQELIPLIKKINTLNKGDNKLKGVFNTDKQKEFSKFLAEYIGFDFSKGVIKESEHPFTLNFDNKDVRITTHYYESDPLSAVFSTIHEGGHAIYEQNIKDEISKTILGEGTSMGVHESQSRMYENMFGRNLNFWIPVYPKLQEKFPEELGDISLEKFYRIVNDSKSSLIRIEADELTYPIHVLIRYELEKEIFETDVDINELPKKWADKYEEYLGIRPETFREGILQDVHWSGGSFGYFSSYALGSAYASQFYHAMCAEFDVEKELKSGSFEKINTYLRENIHQYGKYKNPEEIIMDTTKEKFNPNYYINYLREKYGKLYVLCN